MGSKVAVLIYRVVDFCIYLKCIYGFLRLHLGKVRG